MYSTYRVRIFLLFLGYAFGQVQSLPAQERITPRGTIQDAAAQHQSGLEYLYLYNNTDQAIGHLLNAAYRYESLSDTMSATEPREDLARLYSAHRYYQEALHHLHLLRLFFGSKEDRLRSAFVQSAIADIYMSTDSLALAIPLYRAVEEQVTGLSSPLLSEIHKASITALTRRGYGISGLTDTSSVDFGGLVDNPSEWHALILLNSGHVYYASGEVLLARYYYLRCLEVETADAVIHRDALFKLAEIHKGLGEFEVAYDYLAQYSIMNDSLINDRRQRVIDRLLIAYQTNQQRAKIRDLEKDRKIAVFQNRLQNVVTFSLLIGSVIILIGAYFVIRNYQHRFNANQIIHRQTEEINRQRITELENSMKIASMHSVILGQEAERERIAKDLHDSLGGLLSTVKLHFDAVQSMDAGVATLPEYQRAYTLLDEACNEVRTISNNLQPGALHRLGLIPAIQDLINRVQTHESPAVSFHHNGTSAELDPSMSLNIFRIVQELLNNALKHSGADEISISLSREGKSLRILVQDNGKGYEPGTVRRGMGSENIASRVNYLRGDLSIHSVTGEGTTTQVDIPLS